MVGIKQDLKNYKTKEDFYIAKLALIQTEEGLKANCFKLSKFNSYYKNNIEKYGYSQKEFFDLSKVDLFGYWNGEFCPLVFFEYLLSK